MFLAKLQYVRGEVHTCPGLGCIVQIIHNNPLKGIGVRDFYKGFFVRPFVAVFRFVSTVFFNIWGFPTTTFRRIQAVGTRLTRRTDPRIPEAPKT